jgi:2,3-bisphosphoglycerate-dependent phosphoglycerate mutase
VRLLLIRHGETDHNAGRLALGRQDVPLNEHGRAQAQAIARAYGDGAGIAAIYSSPLQRAVATATPLANALGLAIEADPALIEMDIGEIEGKPLTVVREEYPDFVRRWLSEDCGDACMPGGESLRQVQERALEAVQAMRERHANETLAVVTHNFVALAVLCHVLRLPLARFRGIRQDLGAVSVVDFTPERTTIVTLNDTCHLA